MVFEVLEVLEGAFVQDFLFSSLSYLTSRTPKASIQHHVPSMPALLFQEPPSTFPPHPLSAPSIYRCCRSNTLARFPLFLAPPSVCRVDNKLAYFCEPNIRRFLPKALTADVQPVLANETSRMGANTAVASSCQHLIPRTTCAKALRSAKFHSSRAQKR